MPELPKTTVKEFLQEYECHGCRGKLPIMPPCPKCSTPIKNALNMSQYDEILSFLKRHKGSQARIYLGKKDKESILIYELLTKKQLLC